MTPKIALDEGSSAITPVIVKSGGDPHVSITSSSISFAETVPGPFWSSSQSKEKGRIRKLKIKVGCDTTELPVIPTSQLASVTFGFESAQLIAMESGIPAENNVLLLLTSPEVPFSPEVPVGVVPISDWNLSQTKFPDKIKSLTLMVGDQKQLSCEFQTDDVEVDIYFN
jgi:hypothetical protein